MIGNHFLLQTSDEMFMSHTGDDDDDKAVMVITDFTDFTIFDLGTAFVVLIFFNVSPTHNFYSIKLFLLLLYFFHLIMPPVNR